MNPDHGPSFRKEEKEKGRRGDDSSVFCDYLQKLCQEYSQGKLEIRQTPHGLGAFAKADLHQGDVVCKIPRKTILSGLAPQVHEDDRIRRLANDPRINWETLLHVYMVLHRETDPYLGSLPPTLTELDPDELAGTNVASQIMRDRQNCTTQYQFVCEILGESPGFTLADLRLAKAVYNGRRYPLEFSLQLTEMLDDEAEQSRQEDNRPSKKYRREARAVFDPTQGSLVPILDLFNHQRRDQPHLSFQITEESLIAVNELLLVKAGQEIHHNYDCANNDQCLHQFGFCESGDDDMNVFAVQVGGGQRFELRGHHPIPDELLADGGHGLEQHLRAKLSLQASAPASENPHVQSYMEAQRNLIQQLLAQLDQFVEEDDELSATHKQMANVDDTDG